MSKMTKMVFGLVAASFIVGCGGNDCDKAADDIAAKYEECGVTVADGGDAGDAECTDEAGALATCTATCITGADCSLLDGSATDLDALADFAACAADCSGAGTTGGTTSGS